MAITKEKKQSILATFSDIVGSADSFIFVKFNKLTVKDANILRRKLRAAGLGYKVGKKTLLKRALDAKGFEGTLPDLPGEIAIAYPIGEAKNDTTLTAREVYDFQKTNKELVSIVGGVFEGSYKSLESMMEIATIPGMQTLRGMFVNIINSPIQRFAIALDQIAQKKA